VILLAEHFAEVNTVGGWFRRRKDPRRLFPNRDRKATLFAMSSQPAVAVEIATVAAAITDRSAAGIAAGLSRLISSGRVEVGARLPTVRELAAELGTSPATVAEAWRALTATGAIVARGRAGTFVSPRDQAHNRYHRLAASAGAPLALDLSTGVPDPALLPDLGPALARVAHRAATTSYLDEPVLPELGALLRADWPYPVEAITVVDGALDGIDRVARQLVRLGDHVAVENPGFPPVLDMLERLGAVVVPVSLDARGARPDSLAEVLEARPVALVVQPRAQNPTGLSMTATRVRALAGAIRTAASPVIVIEDNHSGSIAPSGDLSLGRYLPAQTVHIRSYSKSHGPDLRIAALGGPAALVDELVTERHLGPGWTSRLVQSVLVDLLTDASVVAAVERARATYAMRRRMLGDALAAHGIRLPSGDGLSVWLPVADERHAEITLAAAGIGVSPGALFHCGPSTGGHIRLTLGTLPDDPASITHVAAVLAAGAMRPSGTVRAIRPAAARRRVTSGAR
jgi:DNA-binding transcriptional MocR family regulator